MTFEALHVFDKVEEWIAYENKNDFVCLKEELQHDNGFWGNISFLADSSDQFISFYRDMCCCCIVDSSNNIHLLRLHPGNNENNNSDNKDNLSAFVKSIIQHSKNVVDRLEMHEGRLSAIESMTTIIYKNNDSNKDGNSTKEPSIGSEKNDRQKVEELT